jgi:outer membrane protein insertion porin family
MMKIILIFITSFLISANLFAQRIKTARLSKIQFSGEFNISETKLKKAAGLIKNQPYLPLKVSAAVKKLENFLSNQGYLFASVDSVQALFTNDSSSVELIIHGGSGERVYFSKIQIQSDSLKNNFYNQYISMAENELYSQKVIEKDVNALLLAAADCGYPFAEINVDDLDIRKKDNKTFADLKIKIHEKSKVFIKDILLKGNIYSKDHIILRDLNIYIGEVYSKKKIDKIPQRLNRLEILKDVKQPVILTAKGDSVILLIEVEEGNATTFDGVVGYIPSKNNKANEDGYFTGLVNLSFKNLFGTGRKFEVYWKKPDQFSEEFQLAYTEPWVLGWPVDIGAGLDRTVRDTTYIEWVYQFNTRMRIFNNFALLASLKSKMVLPDSAASRDLGLLRNKVINAEVGIEYDTRDYKINPSSGLYYKTTYTYGFKNNYGPSYIFIEDSSVTEKEQLQTIKIQCNWYYNLWKNQVLAVELNGMQITGGRLQLTDYFWFGGSRSLRGYRENQFWGDIVVWTNLEYRFILGRNSRIFLFNDWGFYNCPDAGRDRQEILPGYGVGVRLETPMGILGVDYGLGKGDGFKEGKIHFGIINRF